MIDNALAALGALLDGTQRATQHQLPGLVTDAAAHLGAVEAVVYLADLQQSQLVALASAPAPLVTAEPLSVDGTLAGRAFQHSSVLTQPAPPDLGASTARVWLPLLDGGERLGVLALSVPAEHAGQLAASRSAARFAALVAQLIMTKTMYGDQIVRLRRRAPMGLAAELQWSLLPPSTFTSDSVSIAGALEPAYRVAGDLFDYAVDADTARAVVLDGMGHSLRSSQLAAVASAGYRHARRSGLSLPDSARTMDEALLEAFGGAAFATAALVELDPATGLLSWINAGHPAPLLIRESHVLGPLTGPPRVPLGLRLPADLPVRQITVHREQLQPGDQILLYTDGVTEARTPDGTFFGEQRLTDLLTRNLAEGLTGAENLRRLVRALLEHQQGQLDDDATLLLLSWRVDT